jgi:hypothetical protein
VGKLLTFKTASPHNRAAIIDEFGNLCRLRDEFAPFEKRYGQIREEIKTWYEQQPGEKVFTEKGRRYQLDVGMCANARTIDIRAAYKKLGLRKFLKDCSMTLKALGEYLGQSEIDEITSESHIGPRKLTTTPIAIPEEAA